MSVWIVLLFPMDNFCKLSARIIKVNVFTILIVGGFQVKSQDLQVES